MIYFILGATVISTVLIFCSRHFLIHLLSLKLLIDCIAVLLARARFTNIDGAHFEASSWLFASIGALFFFALIVVSTRQFAMQKDLNVEGENG